MKSSKLTVLISGACGQGNQFCFIDLLAADASRALEKIDSGALKQGCINTPAKSFAH